MTIPELPLGGIVSQAVELGAPYEPPLTPDHPEWKVHVPAAAVDKKDQDTPDNWVRRDPRILRLTGRHPLNCEPPMDVLMEYGFITPPAVHFVRNHGAAPRIPWAEHRIEINGLVDKPLFLTMDELVALPSITFPCTLVCAGNRRKEENMLKKSIGFNWGPCATSTTYWTGVRLRDLLLLAGIKSPEQGANFVCFRGPKGELPRGSDGSYGTSLTYAKAMDPSSDVIIAYKQNHRWLTPDHGFPVRMIIPGFIGGRMVKWLSEITVTEVESQNFYHFMDNRVLPSHVDEALAKEEGWWYKPEFIINDLNINSAVARPWHDEVVRLDANKPYTMRGYAYAGGGRKIIRCEVSLDDGKTWRLGDIQRFEKPNEYGKYWCWVHWSLDVMTFDFLNAKEVLLRAWDETMNTQPAIITWNVMGMMNNCYYRIKIHPQVDSDGVMGLRFQHPAPVELGERGNMGWREEDNLVAQALAAVKEGATAAAAPAAPPPVVAAAANGGPRQYTMEEVAAHNTEESCWFVHGGKVYDATPYLDEHPGGAESILIVAGADATDEFNSIHSSKAKAMLAQYYIGDLVASKPAAAGATVPEPQPVASTSSPAVDPLVVLNPRQKVKLPLIERIELNRNTRIFRFGLPSPQHRIGLPVGKHVFTYATINGENVMRAYTPISGDEELGRLDMLIKVYFANEHPAFPDGGKMSQHFESLRIGDTVEFKGPLGHFVYDGRGSYTLNGKLHKHATHMSFVAGGTGITPCYAVIKAALRDPEDKTQISLVFANNTEEDILLREELDELANNHPDRFHLWHTVSQTNSSDWKFSTGRVTLEMFKQHLFACSGPECLALMCGPPAMLEHCCVPFLESMGYSKEQMIHF
ncbi:nitrate reductase [Volvox carteri f. nagariensis]|uniref:Nitrate reductase [NADH] n=3 Tax=Volvox carteri TaxID=3067 RepID=NIA_VOLCA|nr:nitrate reductase [Volvox carteri f. nagariensis]P36841.1 RecName: Full=Nitrate reductase [NADH]; Short=NR [Volvox carteri]AAA11144.1 nitrate reductase [Volvox carteri]EFJ43675.1 nitrate reductase [Volvox carteri f. nagariensis]CAA45497.1 nitrate reductase (NADH) [Volvox carteri f. nagariensis]|eukprot:XP_002955156.1 nitrate reductase [Volvox carteri f. nagariensis]